MTKGSLSIHCGHTDFYGVRNAGWAQLVSGDNQEMHDLLPIAFKVAELRQVMLPCMVIGDGFVKSHALENLRELSDEFLKYFVGFPNRLYQPRFGQSTLMGTFTDTDLSMEGQVAQDYAYRFFKKGFIAAMNMMNRLMGTNLKVVENYRTEDADMIVTIMGSAVGVVKDVVDYYRQVKGWKVGVVRPVLFAPPCYEELAYGVRKAKAITVLERTGMAHNQLLLADMQAALMISHRAGREGREEHRVYGREDMPTLLHGVYGLGSKDFNKYDAAAAIENMKACLDKKRGHFHRDFFVGVEWPYTLRPVSLPEYQERELGMTFIGIGAEHLPVRARGKRRRGPLARRTRRRFSPGGRVNVPDHVLVSELLGEELSHLGLSVRSGQQHLDNRITNPRVQKPGLAFAGFYEYIKPGRVQIVGESELGSLATIDETERARVSSGSRRCRSR